MEFMGLCDIDSLRVFGLIFIFHGVAFIVIRRRYEPCKDTSWVILRYMMRIEDSGAIIFAVQCCDVVFGDRSPVNLAAANVRPPLNTGEKAFNTRLVTGNTVFFPR